MDRRMLLVAGVVAATLPSRIAVAAQLPKSWDGLVLVKSKKLEAVYLAPGADFAPYSKILLGPTEVAFAKDWVSNYNSQEDIDHRLSESDAQSIMSEVRKGFQSIFKKAFDKAGYTVVDTPAKDVLRLNSAVINLAVTAPDTMADFSQEYGSSSGQATMVLEARNSLTGALLGRAIDAEAAGDYWQVLNSVTNYANFEQVGDQWAGAAVSGLKKLRDNQSLAPPAPPKKVAKAAGKQ